jgi:hypothetical protein
MDGTQIYNNFRSGDPQILAAMADSIAELSRGYLDEAKAIAELQVRMSKSWTGASGDAAYAGAGPLGKAFEETAFPLDETTNAMNTQTASLATAKTSVVPVPPAPEKPSGWSVALKAAVPIVGPSMAASDISSYQDGMSKHNAANETNVRVMDQYASATNSTKSTIPMDYQPLPFDGASVGVRAARPNVTVGTAVSEYTGATHASSTVAPGVGSSMGGNPASAVPTLSGAGNVTAAGPTSGGAGPAVTPPPNLSGTQVPTQGGTGTSAYLPGMPGYRGSDTQRPGSRGGITGTGGGAISGPARNNSAAGRLYASDDEGTGRGSGRSSSSAGRGGSSAAGDRLARGGGAAAEERLGQNRLGGGKSTGAGNLGSAAAAEEAAAGRSTARSATGTPMGAAGQRGRGEDDGEHQRPDYLIEPDPDSIFGSDVRTTPPVIGE